MFNRLSMTLDRQIQMSKFIFREWVCSTLDNNDIRSVWGHTTIHNFFEEVEVDLITNATFEGDIYCEVFTDSLTDWLESTGAREEILLELVETYSHNSVGIVKCFFDSIAMVDIDIQV
jgi:hypothetical protein